jgi:polysaccharide export outer membrane protein
LKSAAGLLIFSLLFSSCKIFYPDRLFKTDKDFPLAKADTLKVAKEYVIRPGDLLAVGIFSNNGYELVDVLTPESNSASSLSYVVKENGYAILPMLDSTLMTGYTVGEAERMLEEKYSYYFVNPFVKIEVTNRRAYVYRGRQGAAVVFLDKENMNLLEVLAKAGGVPQGGKADRIRIIRGDLNHPIVFDVDLSTVEGMMEANLGIQANDVIYIDSRLTSNDVALQINPLLTMITTLLVLTTTIIALSQ